MSADRDKLGEDTPTPFVAFPIYEGNLKNNLEYLILSWLLDSVGFWDAWYASVWALWKFLAPAGARKPLVPGDTEIGCSLSTWRCMRGCLVVKATQSELHYSRLWTCGWRRPVYLLISPSLPTFLFLSKSPFLFWQYFSAINKIQTILRETPLQNPTCNENLMYMMSFTFLLREWCILLNNYYDHNLLLCSRHRKRGTMRSLTIRRHHWRRYFGPFVDEEIFWLKLESPLDTIRQVQRKRMQARQSGRKRKIFRGKRDNDWPLRRTSVVPFGWGLSYTPPMKNSLKGWLIFSL